MPSMPCLSLWCVWEGLEVQSPCSTVQTLTPWGRALPHFLSPALPFLELFRYRNFLLSSHLGPGHSLFPPRLDAQSSRHMYGSLSPIWRATLEQRFPTALGTSSCPLLFFYLPAHEHPGFHACVCRPFVSPKVQRLSLYCPCLHSSTCSAYPYVNKCTCKYMALHPKPGPELGGTAQPFCCGAWAPPGNGPPSDRGLPPHSAREPRERHTLCQRPTGRCQGET